MNVVDSLVLEIGLDPRKYQQGRKEIEYDNKRLRDDAKKTADELEARGGQAAAFFGQIQNKVLGLAASYVGLSAIKSELFGVTDATAALGRAAAVTGAKIQDLDAFGRVIKRNGGDAAAATDQIKGFIASVESFKLGAQNPNLARFLGTIGHGANDTWLDDLKKFAAFAERNKNDPAYVNVVANLGGIGGDATVSELLKGRAGFNADLETARRLGLAEDKDAEAARKLQQSFADLKQAVDAFARDVSRNLSPSLEKALAFLTGWFQHKEGPKATAAGAVAGSVVGAAAAGTIGGSLLGGPAGAVAGVGIGALVQAGAEAKANAINDSINKYGGYFDEDGRWVESASTTSKAATASKSGASPSGRGAGTNLLSIFRKLESSGDSATSYKGAVGRYQIEPGTAAQYGFDPTRLKDPVYNEKVASTILADLSRRYGGDLDAIAIAYHSGPGAADKFLAANRDASVLGPQGRAYLAHERRLTGGGTASTVTIGTIVVNTKATDAAGIAKGIRGALAQNQVANQANAGLQ